MKQKIKCQIPGCERKTTAENHTVEWVCPTHWVVVPRKLKRLLTQADRAFEKDRTNKNRDRAFHIWWRCRDYAINEAVGIGNA